VVYVGAKVLKIERADRRSHGIVEHRERKIRHARFRGGGFENSGLASNWFDRPVFAIISTKSRPSVCAQDAAGFDRRPSSRKKRILVQTAVPWLDAQRARSILPGIFLPRVIAALSFCGDRGRAKRPGGCCSASCPHRGNDSFDDGVGMRVGDFAQGTADLSPSLALARTESPTSIRTHDFSLGETMSHLAA